MKRSRSSPKKHRKKEGKKNLNRRRPSVQTDEDDASDGGYKSKALIEAILTNKVKLDDLFFSDVHKITTPVIFIRCPSLYWSSC